MEGAHIIASFIFNPKPGLEIEDMRLYQDNSLPHAAAIITHEPELLVLDTLRIQI